MARVTNAVSQQNKKTIVENANLDFLLWSFLWSELVVYQIFL